MAVYRRWWAERRVDGVLVVDPRLEDPRVELIEQLGLPAVIIGGPEGIGSLSAVWSDDAGAVVDVVRYLARLGHERIARVAGVPGVPFYRGPRTEAYPLPLWRNCRSHQGSLRTDFMAESGARVTPPAPRRTRSLTTAIIYDSRSARRRRLGAAHEMGLSVPRDVLPRRLGRLHLLPGGHPPRSPRVEAGHPAMGSHGAECAPRPDRRRRHHPHR